VPTDIQISFLHEIRSNECIEIHCDLDFTSVMKTDVRLLGAVKFD